MRKAGAEALLVTNFTNVTYLTGFTGDDSYLLLRDDGETVLSDARYTTQLGEEAPGVDLHIRSHGTAMVDAVAKVVKSAKIGRLGVEADSMTLALRDSIADKLPKAEFVSTTGLVAELRQIKDRDEIARIRKAVRQAEQAFGVLRATLSLEKTEKQVADDLEYQMRLFGSRNRGFQSIVAVGPRAALPHAVPGGLRVGESDFILIDWGADEGLYRSDLTRVLVTGKISAKFAKIYRAVAAAQRRAIAAIRPGARCCDVDRIARRAIAKAGYARYFTHGLGHGLGLEVHEAPRFAAKSKDVLKPGMVVTVEPGIYQVGWGGVRIEDDVLVTRDGHEVLTRAPKKLEEMVVEL
jgi:Xaa-Pro aminopeptidase